MYRYKHYIHIIFRSTAVFLLVGMVAIPLLTMFFSGQDLSFSNFEKMFAFAPLVLVFNGKWVLMAGALFSILFVFLIMLFSSPGVLKKRFQWAVSGLFVGLLSGFLVAIFATEGSLFAQLNHPGESAETVKMLFAFFLLPSAISGFIYAGFLFYPSYFIGDRFASNKVWSWADVLYALPIVAVPAIHIFLAFKK